MYAVAHRTPTSRYPAMPRAQNLGIDTGRAQDEAQEMLDEEHAEQHGRQEEKPVRHEFRTPVIDPFS